MKSVKLSEIEIEAISVSSNHKNICLKIDYYIAETGSDVFVSCDDDLMYDLFNARVIDGWDAVNVHVKQEHSSVNSAGEFITEEYKTYMNKYDYVFHFIEEKDLQEIVRNFLTGF